MDLEEAIVIPAGKSITINLQGCNIASTGTAIQNNGTLTLMDSKKAGKVTSAKNVAVAVGNNSTLMIRSGVYEGREGAVITGKATNAKITIYNGTFNATDNAVIAGNGSKRDGVKNTITIRNGTFNGGIITNGYIACGIYAPWQDDITVIGGTFNITNGAGIVARAGNVKVSGGTFNCTGSATGWVGDNKNQLPCAALVFDAAANYPAKTDDSKITVSNGKFSTDPSANGALLTAGYMVAKADDGMYTVSKTNPTAEVNGTKYSTLAGAINAASGTDNVVKLLQDINDPGYYCEIKDKVTIDLNNHNITGNGVHGVFDVKVNGDLTIKGNGTVTAVVNDGYAMAVHVESTAAKVTLEGGTYKQQIPEPTSPQYDMIYAEYGNIFVKGGTFECASPAWTLNCHDAHYKDGSAKIEVSGGTFKGFDPSNNKAEGDGTNFMAEGYCSVKSGSDSDATYTAAKAVAKVGDVGYAGLQEAIDAANAGDTVTLLTDVEQNSELSIDKGITLDLGGKRMYNTKAIWHDRNPKDENDRNIVAMIQINDADVTLTGNGKVECMQDDCYAINVDGGSLTIENGEYVGNVSAVQVNTGSLTIKGGKFSQIQNGYGDKYLINCIDANYANGSAKVSITGGQFVRFDPSKSPEKAVEGKVPSYCAEGYTSFKNSNGTYGVAKQGVVVEPSEENKNSGSVATDGVTVAKEEQKKVAETAADAAASVKDATVDETKNEAKIGDVTVDVKDAKKAEEVKKVAEKANEENASVNVQLVVKAAPAAKANPLIEAAAQNATVVPFELSVDMVTEVRNSDNEVTATATVPVKVTAEPIKVTFNVAPSSIKGKKVMIARVHDEKVDLIDPISVNEETGDVTFETAKFSDYALRVTEVNQSYDLANYTNEDGSRKAINNAEFNMSDDYAFAGWYKDYELTDPYDSTATSGPAYPKFVKISDLIIFKGGSLRTDLTGEDDYSKTSLRFGYEMHAPEGSKIDFQNWGWYYKTPFFADETLHPAENYWRVDNNGVIANFVLSPIYKSGYQLDYSTVFDVTAQLAYITADGTSVKVKDQSRSRSVNQVAKAIQKDSFASTDDLAYANGILGSN